ncbi:nucleotidyltransferase domain-containing protein [Streptomyces sp. NPDC051784]|uniref:nucleotidyltransferase domain-containing protein n=1 Tax=Streptomyces sp. NPDC051784 TaxID=3155805 RepID=UPI003428FAB4
MNERGLDRDGTIAREGSLDRVPATLVPLVDAARAHITDTFDDTRLHSAYLYGSIPRGTATPGVSDLDLQIVLHDETDALQDLFGPDTVAIVALITCRDGLRARLREAGLTGIPLAMQGTAMIAAYLTAERELECLSGDADIDTLAPTLVGAGHLLFADRTSAPPQIAAVRKMVTTLMAGALRPPQS